MPVEGNAYHLQVRCLFRSGSPSLVRGAQSRIVGIALKMKGVRRYGLTECNIQVAKDVCSGAPDELARQCSVLADNDLPALADLRGLPWKLAENCRPQCARTANLNAGYGP